MKTYRVNAIPVAELSERKLGVLDHTRAFFAQLSFAARAQRNAVLRAKRVAALTSGSDPEVAP